MHFHHLRLPPENEFGPPIFGTPPHFFEPFLYEFWLLSLRNSLLSNTHLGQILQTLEKNVPATGIPKLNLASRLALPLTCLQTHNEILQQYRLALLPEEDDLQMAYIDETLVFIRSMRQRAHVNGATEQALKALLRYAQLHLSCTWSVVSAAGGLLCVVLYLGGCC